MFKRTSAFRVCQGATVGIGLSLFGCGNADRPPQPAVGQDFGEYIQQSCEFTADVGDLGQKIPAPHSIAVGYFGKKFNREWLDAVSSTSIESTVAYIRTTGARVYRASPRVPNSCQPFAKLDPLPPPVESKWAEAERNTSDLIRADGSNAFISGLYLPPEEDPAALIVRADASRWILVHEFMHHNFRMQQRASGFDVRKALDLQTEIVKQLNEVGKSTQLTDEERVKAVVPIFVKMVKNLDRIMVALPFEEMTVESKYDPDNRLNKGRIVEDYALVMTAGIAGFLFTGAVS